MTDNLISQMNSMTISNQNKIIGYVNDDIQAIHDAILLNPEKVDIGLIEFPPILEQEIDCKCLQISLEYLKQHGDQLLLHKIQNHNLHDTAITYLDYYIECLETTYETLIDSY